MALTMLKIRADDSETAWTMLPASREVEKLATAAGKALGLIIEASSSSNRSGRFTRANAGATAHAEGTRCASSQWMHCSSRSPSDKEPGATVSAAASALIARRALLLHSI